MLLTVKDLSTWLNIKASTLYLWAAQGKIPCRKIHGLIRFEKDAILRWLNSFDDKKTESIPLLPRHNFGAEVDDLVARAKRDVYTADHGETRPRSSLIGKEETDGAG